LLINAHSDAVTFSIPPTVGSPGVSWQVVVDTGAPQPVASSASAEPGAESVTEPRPAFGVEVAARAMILLRGGRAAAQPASRS